MYNDISFFLFVLIFIMDIKIILLIFAILLIFFLFNVEQNVEQFEESPWMPSRDWYSKMVATNYEKYNDINYKTMEEWSQIIKAQKEPSIDQLKLEKLAKHFNNLLLSKNEYNDVLSSCVDSHYNKGILKLT